MYSFFKAMLSSLLLRPVFVTLLLVAIIQAILIISLTQSSVGTLRNDVQIGLHHSEEEITAQLTIANAQVSTLIEKMAGGTSESLTKTLTLNLEKEQLIIEESFEYSLEQSSRTLAIIAAQISPPAIWDNDTPELTRIVQMVHQTDNVIFALFLNKEGKPLTRYLNRNDPIVKGLLASSSVRGSVNKVLESAPNNEGLTVIRQPIKSKDVEIGTFILGVSNTQVKAEVKSLKDRFKQLVTDSNNAVKGVIEVESVNVVNTLQSTIKEISQKLEETISTSIGTIDTGATSLSRKLTTLVVITGVILLLVMALLLARQILKKVNILRRALWDIAEGDGDLTQRANVNGNDEIADMATALNRFIEKTQSIIGDVNASADSASNMTGTLSRTTIDAKEAVNKQRLQVDQISSAISQMSSSIQQVAESIQAAAHNAEEIKTESGEASSISAHVNQQLNQLLQDITHANDVVMRLENNSNQIGSVLDVIRGIADQTNLLALNAAIEAARAGESGRGFAVVADEVRALASKTQDSTTEIQKNIESLQEGSKSAVKAISTASQVAQESITAFGSSDKHLEGVTRSVNQLFNLSTEVASMAQQQTHVAEEINLNVTNISEAAEDTATSVDHAAESSKEIDAIVNELKEKVAQFKV